MVKYIDRGDGKRQGTAPSKAGAASPAGKTGEVGAEGTDLGILLALAFSVFATELRGDVAEAGYDDLHRSFGYVARNIVDAPLTLTELASRLGITSPGALKIVQQMEDTGCLERIPDPADARAKRLRLTKRGRAALAAARAFHARFEADLVERHGARKVQAVREVLGEIVARHDTGRTPLALRPM
jgi:DNA-binding MarR family transcriptional regulator